MILKKSLKDFYENLENFSLKELEDISEFFSNYYGKKYISSAEEAFEIILNDAVPKAFSKLSQEAKMDFKKRIMEL